MLRSDDVILVLAGLEFEIVRRRGSHVRLRHPDNRIVTVSSHRETDLGRGITRKILRDAQVSTEEFLRALDN